MKVDFYYTGLFFKSFDVNQIFVVIVRSVLRTKDFQKGSKLDPSKSVLDLFKAIKRKKDQVFNVLGFFWF